VLVPGAEVSTAGCGESMYPQSKSNSLLFIGQSILQGDVFELY